MRGSSLRLFVAAYPPPETVDALLAAARAIALPEGRFTRAEQVHLTLQFIGDVDERDLPDTLESVERAAAGIGAIAMGPRRLFSLPDRGPARLLAAEMDAPAPMRELHDRLVRRLARRPRGRDEQRFLPHVTLHRFRQPARIEPIDHPLDLASFPLTEVRVMRSTLHREGAVHVEVASFVL
jgi:2'-5' RNA ligase